MSHLVPIIKTPWLVFQLVLTTALGEHGRQGWRVAWRQHWGVGLGYWGGEQCGRVGAQCWGERVGGGGKLLGVLWVV